MTSSKKSIASSLLLLLTALVWGLSFTAQSVGMEEAGPLSFNGTRMILGGLALLPVILFNDSRLKKSGKPFVKFSDKTLIKGGLLCGIVLFIASTLQSFGIVRTTVGKSGFITALYVLFVPIFALLFFRKKTTLKIWICAGFALFGMYLLCINGKSGINFGDFLTLLCAIAFSFHILVIDKYSPLTDGIKLSCYQFLTCGIISSIISVFVEHNQAANLISAWLPLCYAAFGSCALGYTLQVVAQKNLNPTVASIICSFESVFALLGGMLLLKEAPSSRELEGCAIMFIAIIVAQIPIEDFIKSKHKNSSGTA